MGPAVMTNNQVIPITDGVRKTKAQASLLFGQRRDSRASRFMHI